MEPMDLESLKSKISAVLRPERDDEDPRFDFPHPRLSTVHGLDTSYFFGPVHPAGDRRYERLLNDESDPLHVALQSITVPASLFMAGVQLFGDSLLEYHGRDQRWDVYRFYPPILMTVWGAFEAWVRLASEVFVSVSKELPIEVADALLERRSFVDDSGNIKTKRESRPVLTRYRLLLKYGFDHEYSPQSAIWSAANETRNVRDSLVHYKAPEAPALTASKTWKHIESLLLLLIEPSTIVGRTLFASQFDVYSALAAMLPLISEFEERPFHKGWPKTSAIFDCPFNGVDEARYPLRWSANAGGL